MNTRPSYDQYMSNLKRLFGFIFCLLLFNSLGFAQVRQVFIDPPEKILEKAKGSRFDYTDAITEVRNGELELATSIKEIYGYILILDDLKAIEVSLDFPVWGVSPVKELGAYLTKIIARDIDLYEIDDKTLTAILNWAESETAFTIIEYQTQKFILQDAPREVCQASFERATLMLDIENKLKAPIMLIGSIESFQRTAFIRLLKTYKLNITVEELNRLLENLRSVESLMEALKYFIYEAYDLKNPQDYLKIFDYVVAVAKINARNFPQPLYDFDNSYGEIISTMVVKMLDSGLWLEEGSLREYRALLKTKDIEAITVQLLNYPVSLYKTVQLNFVADLAKMAIDYHLSVNHQVEVRSLSLVYQEILLGLEIQKNNMEGFFEVEMNGYKSIITVMQTNSSNLSSNISMVGGYSVDNFPFARFNPESSEIDFAKLDREMTGQTASDDLLNKLSLKISGDTVTGTYGNTENIYKITGKRILGFNKPQASALNILALSGKYKSQIGKYKVQLNIKELKSGVYNASLNFMIDGIYTPVLAATFEDFTFFSDKNIAYFTDLRVGADEKIKQLRVYINNEGLLVAQYILAGSNTVQNLILQK